MRRRNKLSETWQAPTRLGARIPMISLIQSLAVAEHLNVRHAANALGVSQSSVSARIKAFEEDLGILLFERHARGVRLFDKAEWSGTSSLEPESAEPAIAGFRWTSSQSRRSERMPKQ